MKFNFTFHNTPLNSSKKTNLEKSDNLSQCNLESVKEGNYFVKKNEN